MDHPRFQAKSPLLITGFGMVLFLIAVVHHGRELYDLNGLAGPVLGIILDGLPALGLAYAGYWLAGTDLSPSERWRVSVWCLLGSILFMLIMGISLLVRAFEGRAVGEPMFPLLLSTEAGGIAGATAGYYTARARTEAHRAQNVSNALGFVNSLIRHDLRNDLTVIKARADLLNTDAGSADTMVESDSASVIDKKADEALTRIETTGAVAKTLTGDPDLERVDLAALVDELATLVGNTHDLTVTTELPDHAPVTANEGLRSVVDNLLENAVEHNDSDDPRVHVEVTTNKETIRLAVADNGPGIPDDQKERLLDPNKGEMASGGISLVQTLVEAYGGEVWVEDNEPRGSVFTVELPRYDTEQRSVP